MQADYPSVLVNSWKAGTPLRLPSLLQTAWAVRELMLFCCLLQFWPAVHFVNFKFVAPQLRVPFVSTASIFWCASHPLAQH